jgi:hypothetical protein
MTHELMPSAEACVLVRRLREIPISEHERQTALEQLRRGERFAEFLCALGRIARRLALTIPRLTKTSWRRKGASYVER